MKDTLNELLSCDMHIGKLISELEFQCLIASRKVFVTSCYLDGDTAQKATMLPRDWFADEIRRYGGMIVADNFEQAEAIAAKRGWGEIIEGSLCDIIPYGASLDEVKINNN
jgi:hypothetical protein